jgi:signal transduction histidine kinase
MTEHNIRGLDSDIVFAVVSGILLILLLIAGITIVFFTTGRQRIRQQIELAETKLAFERELRTVETEVTESIMSQFAQELHDNIGQLLTALHIQVENQKLDHPQIAESFKPAEIYISEINQQLRLLSRTLNNDFIGQSGLLNAIQLEVKRLNALKRLTVLYNAPEGSSNLERNQELMVFRIFQEIAQNALRHAKATNLTVNVENAGRHFKLEVRDDGKGFDFEQVRSLGKSSGLRNMEKRAALAELEFHIHSAPGKGSLFVIEKKDKLV